MTEHIKAHEAKRIAYEACGRPTHSQMLPFWKAIRAAAKEKRLNILLSSKEVGMTIKTESSLIKQCIEDLKKDGFDVDIGHTQMDGSFSFEIDWQDAVIPDMDEKPIRIHTNVEHPK